MSDPITCFAVTDHWDIIPLKEISRKNYEEDEITVIKTEICGEVEYPSHCKDHHDFYFKKLYLTRDGEPDKGNVFMTLPEAKAWALSGIHVALVTKRREIRELEEKVLRWNHE